MFLIGVVTFAIYVVKEAMVPTQTASLQNKVTSLERQASEQSSELARHRERVKELESALKVLKGKLVEAQAGEIFPSNSPYPNGLGKVKLGDRIDGVASVFPESVISRKSSYWTVKPEHAVFHDVTYYFDPKDQDKPIFQMLFFFRQNVYPNTVLRDKLTEASRRPVSQNEEGSCWVLASNETSRSNLAGSCSRLLKDQRSALPRRHLFAALTTHSSANCGHN